MQSKSIKTFTSQADELYRQAQEVKIPDYIPLYIICYETLREQKELSYPKSKRNGKCCKRYSKKISRNRRIQTANALILRKAIISVKKKKRHAFNRPTRSSSCCVDGKPFLYSVST